MTSTALRFFLHLLFLLPLIAADAERCNKDIPFGIAPKASDCYNAIAQVYAQQSASKNQSSLIRFVNDGSPFDASLGDVQLPAYWTSTTSTANVSCQIRLGMDWNVPYELSSLYKVAEAAQRITDDCVSRANSANTPAQGEFEFGESGHLQALVKGVNPSKVTEHLSRPSQKTGLENLKVIDSLYYGAGGP